MNCKVIFSLAILPLIMLPLITIKAQTNTDTAFKPGGKLWGYVFGDYYYKAHSDSFNRGGSNQYTGIEQGRNAFQIRRAYLGYDYDISPKFSAELLLATEDNITTKSGVTSGDLLSDNKLSFYIKLANIRWKNIWKGTDLVVGQVSTPAFSLLIEPTWRYRSIERPIADIRRTSSFDLGAALQGKFDPAKGNFGYNVMVGNGTGARPENDKYKWFYGDVYAKFFDQRLIVDLYADYQRLNWTSSWHHSRSMIKGFAAYTTPQITIGAEAFVNRLFNDGFETEIATSKVDTLSVNAKGLSVFMHGLIIKDKLRYFARFDSYNPNDKINNRFFNKYIGNTSNYNDPSTKEQFITVGLDYTPVKNVHFMPNIWYNKYINQGYDSKYNSYDLVYRITFYYVYGK